MDFNIIYYLTYVLMCVCMSFLQCNNTILGEGEVTLLPRPINLAVYVIYLSKISLNQRTCIYQLQKIKIKELRYCLRISISNGAQVQHPPSWTTKQHHQRPLLPYTITVALLSA